MLMEAAIVQIDEADLSDLAKYLTPNYGPGEFAKWVNNTLDLDLSIEDIRAHETDEQVVKMVLDKVAEAYAKREVEYPVQFMMEMTMAMIRQNGPAALSGLVAWGNTRFGLGWDDSVVRTKMPQQIRDDLVRASREFVERGAIQRAIDEALACPDNEALEKYMLEKHNAHLPFWLLRLQGKDREEAIRARVESVLRAELLQFERFVLLEVLDTAWKDHLYVMDQLRDSIGFRAFSQKDPRIEFKREGSRLYREMLARVRDRVAEYIFKMRLNPQVGPAQGEPQPPQRQQPQPQRLPNPAAGRPLPLGGSSMITGPGLDAPR